MASFYLRDFDYPAEYELGFNVLHGIVMDDSTITNSVEAFTTEFMEFKNGE